ncbi:hypothetical protein [Labrenzia sp. 011]|uniref:hypothetical protein n=1 Tax=Labrenzia sp. 011 TaxID=2171494 RepID=UPI000D51B740|nr:hypothetical protein [Labrenzia sp. 011]PVB59914.1 hypothetical protein DCO57_19645 [Labrenzia sp. 011]
MRPGSRTLAALWGFSEATLFFIVPDVLLTGLALTSLKRALRAALTAALAATLGGALVWICANHDPQATRAVLLHVPGISASSFVNAQRLLQDGLFEGMLRGAFTGLPYKVFAAEAGTNGTSPWLFALASPIVRLPRFVVMVLAARGLSCLVGTRLSDGAKRALALGIWAGFYVFYFSVAGR